MKALIPVLFILLFLSLANASVISQSGERAPKMAPTRAPASFGRAVKTGRSALNPLPDDSVNTVLTYTEFSRLSAEDQGYYIAGLQQLMLKIQAEETTTEYQSAQNILSWLFPDAVADADQNRCVYAGWISEISGGRCRAPSNEGCRIRGEVHCNPLVYGTVSCVKANRSATAACEGKKKTTSAIVREIEAKGKEQDWSNMRADLASYCSNPRPSQGKVCSMIRSQLARLDRVIGRVPRARFVGDRNDNSGPVDIARNAEVTVTPGGASGDANTVVGAPVSRSSDRVTNFGLTRTSGDCNSASLLANLRPESNDNVSSMNFMSVDSAQGMMCSTAPLDMGAISLQRSRISQAARSIRGNDKYANADRRNYQGILSNFNACVRDAQSLRRTGALDVAGSSATLVRNGSLVSIYDESNRPIVGLGSQFDLEGLLRGKGISLCNLRTSESSNDSYTAPRAQDGVQ